MIENREKRKDTMPRRKKFWGELIAKREMFAILMNAEDWFCSWFEINAELNGCPASGVYSE